MPSKNLKVCFIQPRASAVSETFLDSQRNGLNFAVDFAYVCRDRKCLLVNENPVFSQNLIAKVVRSLRNRFRQEHMTYRTPEYVRVIRDADVVLAQYGLTGIKIMEACGRTGKPFVVHFHGYDASREDVLARHQDAYLEMFSTAAAVIAVSRAMETKLVQMGCPSDKLIVSPYGIDCKQFLQGDPSSNEESFVAVGRLVEKKAPHLLLLAFAQVVEKCPQAKLRIVGDGPLAGVCSDMVKALKIKHAVTFLGFQDHKTVACEMQSARAFVQHSVVAASGDSEGTPVAVLESSASGLPVVATHHAGIPDVVVDSQTGFLVNEHDVRGMAESMLELARKPKLAAELGANARKRVLSRYTIGHSIDRLSRILEAAANGESMAEVGQFIDSELA